MKSSKIKRIGLITTLSIALSKIVYGLNFPVQTEYGIEPIQTFYGVRATPVEENANILLNIGKVLLIPVVILIGIFAIVKIKDIKNKNTKEEK